MSYPVAYRRNATAPARGSQTSPVRRPPAAQPPRPANDNWPAPANDNNPPRPRGPARQAAAGFGRRAAPFVRGATRLARVHPALGRFVDVADLVAGYYDKRVAEAMQYAKPAFTFQGYTLVRSCNGGGPVSHISSINGWGTSCGAAAPFVAQDSAMILSTPTPRTFYLWDYQTPYITTGFSLYWRRQEWTRPLNPLPGTFIRRVLPMDYMGLPNMPPMADPFSLPLNHPLGNPEPVPFRWLPYRKTNPFRSPTEGHQFGYEIAPSRLRWRTYGVNSRSVGPGVAPRPVVSPPGHPQPPGPKKHERKSRARGIMSGLLRGGYAVSEGLDVVDAVFDALPAKYRKGAKTPQDKLYRIWKNYRHLDMNKVVLNLIANHYLDKLIGGSTGRADKKIKELTGHHSLPNIWVGV